MKNEFTIVYYIFWITDGLLVRPRAPLLPNWPYYVVQIEPPVDAATHLYGDKHEYRKFQDNAQPVLQHVILAASQGYGSLQSFMPWHPAPGQPHSHV